MKTVYKIVSIRGGIIESYFLTYYSLVYKINEITIPKIGKIFAFDSLENAKTFLFKEGLIRPIFEAEATNVTCARFRTVAVSKYIAMFWREKNHYGTLDCPTGTVFCDSLKLIKQV